MNTKTGKIGLGIMGMFLMALVMVVGALGLTATAAKAAIPGDALYPLKTTVEQTRMSLARDAGDRAELNLRQADERLKEIAALIKEGRHAEISRGVLAFESDLNSAILELGTLAKTDPSRAGQVAIKITEALTRYAMILSDMAASAPESVRPEVLRALDTTRIAGGLDLSVPVSGVDDGNTNGNENYNGDDSNTNDGLDDNSNDGLDDNGNTNDDSGNTNDDSGNTNDDSGNTNDDDGSNTNDDSGGSNSNDDSGGSNSNDDSGGGSNSNDDSGGGSNSNDDNGGGSNSNDD